MRHITVIVLILGLCLPQALIAGEVLQTGENGRLKETTDTLFVKKENKPGRIVGKLAGGVLGGILFGVAGGLAGVAIGECGEDASFCELENFFIGGWYGYVVGFPIGMNRIDPQDRFTYS